jgi:hypothetical protein
VVENATFPRFKGTTVTLTDGADTLILCAAISVAGAAPQRIQERLGLQTVHFLRH